MTSTILSIIVIGLIIAVVLVLEHVIGNGMNGIFDAIHNRAVRSRMVEPHSDFRRLADRYKDCSPDESKHENNNPSIGNETHSSPEFSNLTDSASKAARDVSSKVGDVASSLLRSAECGIHAATESFHSKSNEDTMVIGERPQENRAQNYSKTQADYNTPVEIHFCVMCGAPIRDGIKFCENCGARIEGRE